MESLVPRHDVGNDNQFGPSSNHRFDFTLLFEQAILSIIPSSILLLSTSYLVPRLCRQAVKTTRHPIEILKLTLTLSYAAVQLAVLALASTHGASISVSTSVPSAALSFTDSIAIVVLSTINHKRSVRPSSVLSLYLLFSALFDAVQIRTLYLTLNTPFAIAMCVSLGFKLVLLALESLNKRSYLRPQYQALPPETIAGVINWTFFWWINDLFRRGFNKILTISDIWSMDVQLRTEPLGHRIESVWDQRTRPENRFTLPLVAFRCLWRPFVAAIPARLCLIGFNFAQPFLINRVISILQGSDSETPDNRYGLIGATALIYLGIAICNVQSRQRVYRWLTMFRGATISLIYSKSLKLQDGLHMEDPAITLMSTDIDVIVTQLVDINETWANLLEVCIGTGLLARQVGAICVVPVVLAVLSSWAQSFVANRIVARRQTWNRFIQTRVSLTASMLNSIKAVKAMGLADYLTTMIQNSRVEELNQSTSFLWLILALNIIAQAPHVWAPVITFVAYAIKSSIQGSSGLDTAQAFTTLALLYLVTDPAHSMLSAIPQCASALGCFARIQNFLLLQGREDKRLLLGPAHPISSQNDASPSQADESEVFEMVPIRPKHSPSTHPAKAVIFDQVSVRPSLKSSFALLNLSLNIDRSSLTVITGPVGCGKTTLLRAILGEIACEKGTVAVCTKNIAFCSQTPWLLNTTIREAVCGMPGGDLIDDAWFKSVIQACALDQDFKRWPDADMTVIGSKGVTLSGGQKQRLALARAIYSRKEIVILDDVLSALDVRTEAHVIDCLLGRHGWLRKMKSTVILVTQSSRAIRLADNLYVLSSEGQLDSQLPSGLLANSLNEVSRTNFSEQAQPGTNDQPDDPAEDPEIIPTVITGLKAEGKEDMTRRSGDITLYSYYASAIGSTLLVLFVLIHISHAFARSFSPVWLELWTKAGTAQLSLHLSIYILLALSINIFNAGTIWIDFVKIMPKSATNLHQILLDTVMKAPQSFFDGADTGVTLNRFSQDMELITSPLVTSFHISFSQLLDVIASLALIASASNYIAIIIPFVLVAIYIIQNVYLRTSRQLRLLDLESRSPLYSHFLETIDGLATIRAFRWEHLALAINIQRLDSSQSVSYMLFCVQRWLQLVLDLLVAAIAVVVVALAMTLRSSTSAGLMGVALSNILSFNSLLSALITAWTQLETSLGAIARVRSFEKDTPCEIKEGEDTIPHPSWPDQGGIELKNVTAAYNNSSSLAIDNLSLQILPGQKIGICGRTGSGKSTLLSLLLRLLDTQSGTITLDGVDISSIPRRLLRERLTAIPQDVFLLSGSIRLNADPRQQATDAELIAALTKVQLWDKLAARGGLQANMQDTPLSKGEQQLFFLARAMLGSAKVVLLDEATSNVDAATDALMQRIVRDEFTNATVLCVAHRLGTIMDADTVVVLDAGRVVECGSPGELMVKESGRFKELVKLQGNDDANL